MQQRFFYCSSILQTGHITLNSTPDQQLENHSTKYHRQQPLCNTLELLMIGIVVPETCWASNKICNKKPLLHLVGILFPHHKVLFSSTCFEQQVLIFRRIQLYTCSIWYCQSCVQLHVYNCILLKMSTWVSKHLEENNILWINDTQCIKLVINI